MDEDEDEDETEYMGMVADCRGRTDPPILENYFGNCLAGCLIKAKHSVLVGEEGFPKAAELIGEGIRKKMNKRSQEGMMEGTEIMFAEVGAITSFDRFFTVAGSPKLPVYDLDFGFGTVPMKREIVSIDGAGTIALTESRNSKGGVEIGLSLPVDQMKAFSDMFVHGLQT